MHLREELAKREHEVNQLVAAAETSLRDREALDERDKELADQGRILVEQYEEAIALLKESKGLLALENVKLRRLIASREAVNVRLLAEIARRDDLIARGEGDLERCRVELEEEVFRVQEAKDALLVCQAGEPPFEEYDLPRRVRRR